jgi:hypothetical protein
MWAPELSVEAGSNRIIKIMRFDPISTPFLPNYLGEIMIYGSFAMMVWHWLPFVVLAWVWLGLFAVNMHMKEASMSRYPEWAVYKKRTWWLIPFVL